jgi:hypothetical protein
VQANGVTRRNNSTRNDVVSIEERASNRLADAIDINRGSGDEGNDVTDGRCQEAGDHQNTEPTHINAVVGVGDPLTEAFPATEATTANCGGHEDGVIEMYAAKKWQPLQTTHQQSLRQIKSLKFFKRSKENGLILSGVLTNI